MTSREPDCRTCRPARRAIHSLLLVWMIAVMFASWLLFDGPGVSSLAGRSEPIRSAQTALREAFGRPSEAGPP